MTTLIKCEDCGKKVSINAVSCPNCGSLIQNQPTVENARQKILTKQAKQQKNRESNKNLLKVIGITLVCFFFFGILSSIFSDEKPESIANTPEKLQEKQREKEQKQKQEAFEAKEKQRSEDTSKVMLVTKCEMAVKPNLKNPRSMDVDFTASERGTYKGNLALVLVYYAQNGFGATQLNKARCVFDLDGNLKDVKAL